jgi:hypothetical protein
MLLEQLQQWYQAQCNDEWEHQSGIRIETLDNPGWLVRIDLVGTGLVHLKFDPVQENVDPAGFQQADRWLHCRVVGAIWEGAGDETKLSRILEEFLTWAEAVNDEPRGN